MTLQASGAISLGDLIAEFGGGTKLSDFYRGGGLVPDIAPNAGVPTSGAIKLSDFYSTTNMQVNLPAIDIQDDGFVFVTNFAQATVTFESDGDVILTGANVGAFDNGDWVTPPSAAPGLFEVRCDVNSGSVSGATGTWLALTSSRSWTVFQSGAGFASANVTISVRYNGGAVLDSVTGTISAFVS